MKPAVNYLKKHGIEHQVLDYQHDASAASYGAEAAAKLNLPEAVVYKTLVVSTDSKQLAVAIIPVSTKLNLKKVASVIKCKKVMMAEPAIVERTTGYVLGGVSPLGQKKRLTTVVDSSALQHDMIYVSAGKRGLEIGINPTELIQLLNGMTGELSK